MKNRKGIILLITGIVIFVAAVIGGVFLFTNKSGTASVSNTSTTTNTANTTGTAENATGDVMDDRPDDADSVGGDNSTATTTISAEARAWANANGFDLAAFEDYTAPAAHAPTAADITAFENWMNGGSNPRNQVMKQIQSLAGESIANELWNYTNTIWKKWMNTANVGSVVSRESGLKNVGAMQEGMFAGYFGSLIGNSNSQDGYNNAAILIKDGFVVSSDGVTYRLHNIIDGTVAYEIAAPESATVSEDEFPDGLLTFTDFLPLEKHDATIEAKQLLKEYATAGNISEPSNVDRTVYEAAQQYVNNEFGEYYGQCPGPTVVKGIKALGIELDSATEDTVGSSVGEREFVASFFGVDSAAAQLWRLGFLPSFDGTTYRLHSGKDGTVVYEATKAELPATDFATTSNTIYWIIDGAAAAIGLVLIILGVIFIKKKPNLSVYTPKP
jgi:predicted cobalt transporter CbtA